ncbi:pyruvate kinase alpha/beta domain-containing protein [Methanobacterium sp.]|uniref:pyruvate kinase alpha/beta domain-containing protein n=1 Tax=Methanobacterium sp. TaxID=2164 RepID=UPI002ABC47B6|nr:pyruvate kinase alpha/beta domain-containing protein [Methanobacterium sp.]MDY9923904.1 pyruvate kinase alpha/beta domain-containing protein [Methanobacterium sp.]
MKVFKRPGPVNTDELIKILKKASSEYETVVVASVTGSSAVKIAETLKDKNIVCVTCPQGMYWEVEEMDKDLFAEIPELRKARDEWVKKGLKQVPMNITSENKVQLDRLNVEIVRGTIPLFGPTFSMRLHLQRPSSLDVMAKTLELISPGTLVTMEAVLMATDAGVILEDELVLACAGTEMGLDTLWVLKSCASANLFHPSKGFRFVELLAKPGVALNPDINIEYLR